jgi:uncharacterized membrane protein HdeD (DUF308 family)
LALDENQRKIAALIWQVMTTAFEFGATSMADSRDYTHAASGHSVVHMLRANWRWVVTLGAIYFLAALVALCSIVLSRASSVLVVGIMMMVAGAAEVLNACQLRSWGKFFLWIALGALYILAGFATFENPVLAKAFLTVVLGISLVISGCLRLILGFGMALGTPWALLFISGVITFLLGLVILAHWPVASIYTLGLLLGIDLLLAGIGWIVVGLSLRRGAALGAIDQ